MISTSDIAKEFQKSLGDKYTLHVDNNAGQLLNIKTNETFQSKMLNFQSSINGLMTSSNGQVVALPELFSTSYTFKIDFFVEATKDIDPDLNALIQAKNGKLENVDGSKYLVTFNTPTSEGMVEVIKGVYYKVVSLSGNIAVTDASIFGNELMVEWGGVDLSPMLINTELSLGMEMSEQGTTDASLIPQSDYVSASSTATLTLHMRKEGTGLWSKVLGYILNPNQLKETQESLRFIPIGDEENSYTWNSAKILGINTVLAIGGYVMVSITFQNFEVIE